MSYEDDDDGEGWVEKICNDPKFVVIGDGESLTADWPGWLREVANARQELFDEAESLGLDGSDYALPPDRDDSADVEDFLEGLGVSVSTDFIERTGCSSHDGFAYVRKKSIPALVAREERRLEVARRRLLKDAVKRLTPEPDAPYSERLAVLKRMLDAQDEDFIAQVGRLEEAETARREAADLVARFKNVVEALKAEKEALEGSLAGEAKRLEASLAEEARKLAKYEELAVALRLRFGVTLEGPLLTFADGTGYLIDGLFGEALAAQPGFRALLETEPVKSGRVRLVTFRDFFRKGFSRGGPLEPGEVGRRFGRRFSWGRAWWVVLCVTFGFFEGRFEPSIPLDLRIPDGRADEWRALLKQGW
jgi:hypothetical protein